MPEIVEAALELPVHAIILDGEAIALTPGGRPLPFQITMRRFGRKEKVDEMRRTLPLRVTFFDCLHLEGEDLIDRPGQERFDALAGTAATRLVVPRLVTDDSAEAGAFLEWQTRRLLELAIARDTWTVHVRPELVVEVAFNDIQESPHYPGGLALRFARVKRYRPEKRPEDADTIGTVREIHARMSHTRSVTPE